MLHVHVLHLFVGPTRMLMFVCCREGKKKDHTERQNKTRQTRAHSTSRKLATFCLARMAVPEHLKSGRVDIRYISTHTNHELGIGECKYLPLPPSVKRDIQQQFAEGKPLERIMDGKGCINAQTVWCSLVPNRAWGQGYSVYVWCFSEHDIHVTVSSGLKKLNLS